MSVGTQALLAYIASRDHRVMHRVNSWRPPRWIRLWMICATRGGDGWLWYAMGLIVLLFGGPHRFAAVGAASAATAVGILTFIKLKRACNRRRPCSIAPHCWASLLPPDQFSFPSGHSITACAVATPLCLSYYMDYTSLVIGLIFCAASVAVSRVMLGLHFLSDVIAGCAIGFLLGYAAFLIF